MGAMKNALNGTNFKYRFGLNSFSYLKCHFFILTNFLIFFSVKDWLALIPPTAVVGGISYYSYQTIKKARQAGNGQINPDIRKDINKVVDFIDIEDITEKASLCRCWKSKNVCNCFQLILNVYWLVKITQQLQLHIYGLWQ